MGKVRVAVIKNNLKYRIPDIMGGQSFVPKIGQIIALPKESAIKELNSGNVRKLLPEEKESIENRKKIKKKKKES